MKIWYISQFASTPSNLGGLRQFALSKYLSNKGEEVTLIYSRSNGRLNNRFCGISKKDKFDNLKCIQINGPISRNGINIKRKLSMVIFETLLLMSTIFTKRKYQPDVIIASSLSLFTFFSGVVLKKRFKSKLILEVRDIHPESFVLGGKLKENSFGVKILRKIEKLGYKNADGIVSTMPKFDIYMKRKYPNIGFKHIHISQGFDKELIHSVDSKIDLPLGFNVCYAGSMGVANKLDLMIDAAILLKDNTNINFFFIGKGPMKEITKNKTRNIKTIHFLDPIPRQNVIPFLSNFDLQIMAVRISPIYEYGISPNKMVDYLLSGRPILVAYNGYKDILDEVNCGKYIETDNPKLLADTILEFSKKEKNELLEMGERGKKYAESNMDFEILSTKLLDFIKSV